MKKTWKMVLVAGMVAILVASLSGVALAAGPPWKATDDAAVGSTQARGFQSGCANAGTTANVNQNPVSDYEEQSLLLMFEEEKLARDVYNALYAKWAVTQFSNIAASESRHMASVERLIDRYGLTDPGTADTPGVFVSDKLQAAYDQLVAEGTASLEQAFQVGVKIEELDIADLEELIAQTDHADISRVMQNLLRGSQNHLAAFTALLAD